MAGARLMYTRVVGPQAMQVLIAALLSAAIGIAIDWVVNLKMFHRFRMRTPGTYRERQRHMLIRAAIVLAAFLYAAFFVITGGIGWLNVDQWVRIGVLYGFGAWAAFILPVLLSMAIFVNLHRGVVIGLLLDWLLISVAFGLVCSAVIVR
jgi:hypothetical protein